jgi:acyl-CoA synthetase (AMP-forming)/AMP-acid ligase II
MAPKLSHMESQSSLGDIPTIPRLAAYAAHRYGGRLAIDDGTETYSYIELERGARAVAKALLALEVRHGDRIAIWAPNCARWILAALGTQMAGGIPVPLNTRLKGREAGLILRKSGARLLFTVNGFLGIDYPALLRGENLPSLARIVLMSGQGDSMDWESFLRAGESASEELLNERFDTVREGDYSDLIFTSGTTGLPKGVLTTHGQNLAVYRIYSRGMGLNEDDRFLMINPFFHSFGYKAGWLSALMRGALMLPQAIFDAQRVLQSIERERITVLPGPPTLYQSLLEVPNLGDFDRRSLRLAITGAATIPPVLIRRMKSILGFRTVLTAYGLTETCGTVSMCSENDDPETIATTSGRALPEVEVRVVDDTKRDVEPGSPGEILVRGMNVMKGYFDDEGETARAIDSDGWLRTGDIGSVDAAGYIRITDRKKDVFIVGGFNCYPAEIENILITHPGIAQVAVVGVPDQRLGQVACAYVVPRRGVELAADEIISWSRENMANYKVPRIVNFVDSLPMNASGKVQRFALRKNSA